MLPLCAHDTPFDVICTKPKLVFCNFFVRPKRWSFLVAHISWSKGVGFGRFAHMHCTLHLGVCMKNRTLRKWLTTSNMPLIVLAFHLQDFLCMHKKDFRNTTRCRSNCWRWGRQTNSSSDWMTIKLLHIEVNHV